MAATLKFVHAVVCAETGNVLHGPVASSLEVYSTRQNADHVRQARYNQAEVKPCVLVDEAGYRDLETKAEEQLTDEARAKIADWENILKLVHEHGYVQVATSLDNILRGIISRLSKTQQETGILLDTCIRWGYTGANAKELTEWLNSKFNQTTTDNTIAKLAEHKILENIKDADGNSHAGLVTWVKTILSTSNDEHANNQAILQVAMSKGYRGLRFEQLVQFIKDNLLDQTPGRVESRITKEHFDKLTVHKALHHLALNSGWNQDACSLIRLYQEKCEDSYLYRKSDEVRNPTNQAKPVNSNIEAAEPKYTKDVEAAINRITAKINSLRKHTIGDDVKQEEYLLHYEQLLSYYLTKQ